MPINEETRHKVFQAFESTYGGAMAGSIMDMLPPAGVPELATKADIDLIRAEMSALGQELRGEISALGQELRGEISTLGQELRGEISGVDHGLRTEMSSLEARLQAALREQSQTFTRLMLTAVALAGTIGGAVGGLTARLG